MALICLLMVCLYGASAPNSAKKFFELYGWSGLSDVEPIQILRVVMDDPNLTDVVKLEANDLNVYWRLLHHMVCNIILPRIGKFEYVILLDLFVMYCLITLEMGGEEKENPKESKEYNKKTPMLMGFIENENGEWVKKGVVTPQKGGPESNEDDEVEAEEPEGVVAGEATPHPATSLAPTSSSRVDPSRPDAFEILDNSLDGSEILGGLKWLAMDHSGKSITKAGALTERPAWADNMVVELRESMRTIVEPTHMLCKDLHTA
ncbi:hypothetical protein CJ030_MR2G024866 [Morella rubra]|uniref:Uncharacterized protein n=1 Tax=Morella rubra TaxID=262757 RepID=A0A6A1WJS5_9ROSI|nr:hypothetical protein CJ030_MR2G024866 [Morella rubra]